MKNFFSLEKKNVNSLSPLCFFCKFQNENTICCSRKCVKVNSQSYEITHDFFRVCATDTRISTGCLFYHLHKSDIKCF